MPEKSSSNYSPITIHNDLTKLSQTIGNLLIDVFANTTGITTETVTLAFNLGKLFAKNFFMRKKFL